MSSNSRTPMHPYSGAWENEFDTIYPDGRMSGSTLGQPTNPGWQHHCDGTTGTEHASPVWSSVRQAAESIKRQYEQWSEANGHAYPLAQNGHGLHSSGHHIHIGKGRGTNLDQSEITAMGNHYRLILPLIQAISAAPLPSSRGLHGSYCNSILNYRNNFTTDHYSELSWNREIGTGEIRIPDPNIPQVVLTNIYLLGHISEHAREFCHCTRDDLLFSADDYSRLRTQALTHGVVGIPMPTLLTRVKTYLGDFSRDFELTAIRDVLFMASKYYSSPHQVFTMMRPRLYDYMKAMFDNPQEYLANLAEITTGENQRRVQTWLAEAQSINTVDQLITLAQAGMANMRVVGTAQIPQAPVVIATATFTLNRSEVQRAMQSRGFLVVRITDVPGLNVEQVRAKIAFLLSRCGDGFTNPVTAEQVSELATRFYVMIVPRINSTQWDIVGCIGINVGTRARNARNSEVGHLAVHRMYRRLGIAKVLVNHVKNIALENGIEVMHSHIKIGNTASENLFRQAGYLLTVDSDHPEPNPPQGSRKFILQLHPPSPQVQATPPPAPPATPEVTGTFTDNAGRVWHGPTQGAFTTVPERGQTTLEDLVRRMREEERREQ